MKEKIDTFEADDMPQSRAYTARLEVLSNDYDTKPMNFGILPLGYNVHRLDLDATAVQVT